MGLKDRVLNFVAARFGPTMDHPGSGGMAGDARDESDDAEDEAGADEPDDGALEAQEEETEERP